MITAPTLELRLAQREPPDSRRVMHQRWEDLLFLHWRFQAEVVQRSMPQGLTVDTFDGSAWGGVVPFFMRWIRPVFCPPLPWISWFLELNLRTYVHDAQGRPGVWFYSLDCNQPVAVWTARTFFSLPYFPAKMTARNPSPARTIYTSRRRDDAHESRFDYELARETRLAEPGTLEFFLIERYLLYTQTGRGLRSGRVHHPPYPLAEVKLRQHDTRLFSLNGFDEPRRPPDHVIGSPGVRVSIHGLDRPV